MLDFAHLPEMSTGFTCPKMNFLNSLKNGLDGNDFRFTLFLTVNNKTLGIKSDGQILKWVVGNRYFPNTFILALLVEVQINLR